ncbi:phage tail sheath subtilisin-like domain-containing protein [Agromyces sp. SYSU K20354]|uniref:phage tail sheath family protein n=1 Tax=Agromyces cavernae TaxID=2898659 RepID=UPI001E540475|nr:phage tail sheath subtilisin-like domain-containing protein [Agromyces cavernae]MCD2442998.1 phage tail sheath subtilisin-like domain-containing protein [Agromyces cavernae]
MTRPIEGVGTAVAAFVGLAPGPPDFETPTTFDEWGTDEDALFDHLRGRALGSAVRAFFENGGRTAVVIGVEDAGSAAVRAGLEALDTVDLVNLLVLPAESADREDARDTVAEAVAFCERRRAMLLVGPPPGWTDTAAIEAALARGVEAAVGTSSPNAALYLPRLRWSDPVQGAVPEVSSAAGAVAGVIARTDATEGVWSAPAGMDAELRGAVGLDFELDQDDAHALNTAGVNTLRMFPGRRSPIVWGARTLAGADSAASEWKYVPVRRTALFLEESIERGLDWTQFEPNDGALWETVRDAVGTFLYDLHRAGAFQGRSPRDAYFVRCDRDTMTQHDRETGRVVVRVGFAPIRPGEFVVLTILASALPAT